jgi:acetyl esterase/lipase
MTAREAPVVTPPTLGLRYRALSAAVGAALAATLVVSPAPAALVVRRLFAMGGSRTKAILDRHAPGGVTTWTDRRFGPDADARLDVTRPTTSTTALPLVVWVHGGGWVGGSKDELSGWAAQIAAAGYVVGMLEYSLAPGHRYPTPLRQVMQALEHLRGHATELGLDPDRIVLAGDSAGAQIAAQAAALVTTPGYAAQVGVAPTVEAAHLRATVLACGPYDVGLLNRSTTAVGRRLTRALLWAYTGERHVERSPLSSTISVTDHLTGAFPPTLVTVGNADPLRAHTEALAERLRSAGAPVETVFWPDDQHPPLGHEYQFDLDQEAARAFVARMLGFLAAVTRDSSGPGTAPH